MCIGTYAQSSEEPPVLSGCVALLEQLLDGLLSILSLRNLLKGIRGNSSLQALKLKLVPGWEKVGVVDSL